MIITTIAVHTAETRGSVSSDTREQGNIKGYEETINSEKTFQMSQSTVTAHGSSTKGIVLLQAQIKTFLGIT